MTRVGKSLLCGAATLALCAGAPAITADNPYKTIVDRNVFGLKDPPPPPAPVDTSKPQPSKITITGITTILGNKRVLLKTAAAPPKPGEQPKGELSYILTEGQRDGDIEVIQIDEIAGSAKISNAGVIETLTFEKNGPKLPNTPPPPAGGPGIPAPALAGGIPTPTGGHATVAPAFASANRSIPTTRTVRTPGTTPQGGIPGYPTANPAYGTAINSTANAAPVNNSGGFSLGGGSSPGNQTKWPPEQILSREEQMALMELERERLRLEGNAAANLLPTTSATPQNPEQSKNPPSPGNNFPPLPPGTPKGF